MKTNEFKETLDKALTKEEQEDLGRILLLFEYMKMPADERFWKIVFLPVKLPIGVYTLLQMTVSYGDNPDQSNQTLAAFAGLVFQEGIKHLVAPLLEDPDRVSRLMRSYQAIDQHRKQQAN